MTEVTSDVFRLAMAHFATGVAVVTAEGEQGEQGATISALSSVSLDPLTLLICVNRASATCRAVEHAGRFALSILSREQEAVARHFALPSGGKDDAVPMHRHEDGRLFVKDALVEIGCTVVETLRGGTHEIFLARPDHITMNSRADAAPLLYFRGSFSLSG
ncbi:flavin reductase family protein [Acidomonas methanolica]|uniref:Flavin mononucleotide (FMN) reductase n=1 Tax=Acidomonas methanolica NBRC 104435 TaxID=1231351 RepID=A0A023D7L5_ACIMT|nr:flavin reductase family protein [Acidomonas methanolica]MBU2655435.1 flavin reductase family protein [Acidomonas methanolica]GAJ29695.1 flavin mononucleotide (FMN) reductase [Acidomonas methanolica NBRC 104435]GBQ48798.1 flavin mononucleotide reductase [Acidomonas methanolica]GEL00261.1 flavin reductase [Acidomonas methanolica NBRC 104435]